MNGNFVYSGYLRPYGVKELTEDLSLLTKLFGRFVRIRCEGCSEMGRDIPVIRLGCASKKLFLVGSIHGREFVSTAFIMRSLFELMLGCTPAELKSIFCRVSLLVMPMANPDGVEIALGREKPCEAANEDFKLWKNNARNINLNANFPYKFSFVPLNRQGGNKAASESETKALIDICRKEEFAAAISLHARGNCIFWRDMGNGSIKGDFNIANKLRETCGFELITPTKCAKDFSGGFENWFRCEFKRPALCVELVKDESLSFSQLCTEFDSAVLWQNTRHMLKTFLTSV